MDFTDFADLFILDLKDVLCDYNKELLLYIEDNKDIFPLIRAFEETGISNSDEYDYAIKYKDIIGPKVYVGDYDISNLINDFLNKVKGFEELINTYYDRLGYCLNNLNEIAKSRDDFAGDVFKKYLSRLEKLYKWNGNDLTEFRAEMKQVARFKKDCEFSLTYKISSIDMKDKIDACKSPQEAFKLFVDTIKDKSINDFDIRTLRDHFDIKLPHPKEKISYTKFLEDKLLFDYKSSSSFFKGEDNLPNKKQICLYLALFIEIPIFSNIERFLNINGVSLRGTSTYINDYCNVSDMEIRHILNNGFDKESLLFYLKKFAYTKQRYIK